MKEILTRRLMRLNLDYALAIIDGRDVTPFKRRGEKPERGLSGDYQEGIPMSAIDHAAECERLRAYRGLPCRT